MENIKKITLKEAGKVIKERIKVLNKMLKDNVPEEIVRRFNTGILLMSSPGIGKTTIVKEIAEELGIPHHIIVPALRDPGDLLGIPFPSQDNKTTIRLRPKDIIPEEKFNKNVGIYCVDEITSCESSIQAALYGLMLEGKIDGYELPSGWVRIATGNLNTDNAIVFNLSSALINRMEIYHIVPDVEVFAEYIINKYKTNAAGIVAAYLNKNTDKLHTYSPDNYNGEQFASPRKWEKVVISMDYVDDYEVLQTMLGADLGVAVATHFIEFSKIASKIPDIDKIFKNPEILKEIISSADKDKNTILSALSTLIPTHILRTKDVSLLSKFEKVAKYLPKEIVLIMLKMLKSFLLENSMKSEVATMVKNIKKDYPEIF